MLIFAIVKIRDCQEWRGFEEIKKMVSCNPYFSISAELIVRWLGAIKVGGNCFLITLARCLFEGTIKRLMNTDWRLMIVKSKIESRKSKMLKETSHAKEQN